MFFLNTPFRRFVLLTYVTVVLVFVVIDQLGLGFSLPSIYDLPFGFIAPGLAWVFMFAIGVMRFGMKALWLLLAAPVAAIPILFPCNFVPCHSGY